MPSSVGFDQEQCFPTVAILRGGDFNSQSTPPPASNSPVLLSGLLLPKPGGPGDFNEQYSLVASSAKSLGTLSASWFRGPVPWLPNPTTDDVYLVGIKKAELRESTRDPF